MYSGSEMVSQNMVLKKIYFGLLWYLKDEEEKFLNSYVVLCSHLLNGIGQLTICAGFYGACYYNPQKYVNSKNFPPLHLIVKIDKKVCFPETCFACTILEPKFTVCTGCDANLII